MNLDRHQFPKRCSCGRGWCEEEWSNLPLVGVGKYVDRAIELRNCVCGSTLSVRAEWCGTEEAIPSSRLVD